MYYYVYVCNYGISPAIQATTHTSIFSKIVHASLYTTLNNTNSHVILLLLSSNSTFANEDAVPERLVCIVHSTLYFGIFPS